MQHLHVFQVQIHQLLYRWIYFKIKIYEQHSLLFYVVDLI